MKEVKSFWKNERILELADQTAKELGEDPLLVKEVISDVFLKTRRALASTSMKDVLLHRFGSFRFKQENVDYYIRKYILKYKKGHITKEYLKYELEKLFKKRNEYKKSSNTR